MSLFYFLENKSILQNAMSQCVERRRSSCKLKGARGAPTSARSSGTDAAGKAMKWSGLLEFREMNIVRIQKCIRHCKLIRVGFQSCLCLRDNLKPFF